MERLSASVQNYAWGKLGKSSTVSQLAELNGDISTNPEARYAEYWFGTHHAGPSSIRKEDGTATETLSAWLFSNKDALGAMSERPDCIMSDSFCGLPYLAKVLSIAKCLSIQAHPDKVLAEQLHSERPEVYKDPNHKPEMAIALTPFEAMCGFRNVSEILTFAATVPEFRAVLTGGSAGTSAGSAAIQGLEDAFSKGDDVGTISAALQTLFRAYANADPALVAAQVELLVQRVGSSPKSTFDNVVDDPSGAGLAETLAVRLASQFPGDIGVFAPFLLNFMRLQPGDAIFLAANEPHAYVSGDCFEVMANSNNVVRMGCTPKLRDVPVLIEMLTFSNGLPHVLRGEPVSDHVRVYKPTDPAVTEFQVERIEVAAGQSCALTLPSTPAVVIVVKGQGTLSGVQVSRGHVFIQRAGTELEVAGSGQDGAQIFRVQCREE
jgi:mannose-6-phosphate isomerase